MFWILLIFLLHTFLATNYTFASTALNCFSLRLLCSILGSTVDRLGILGLSKRKVPATTHHFLNDHISLNSVLLRLKSDA
ncbi:unnamed protein product [Lactuca virosa]|uniref:Secreted protein n=1 Tax=Lactuca virosa TaxID=75947 RepID=A0AAU9PQ12_9ASTR|nr:unnamed protein product [Lactuca virosa]